MSSSTDPGAGSPAPKKRRWPPYIAAAVLTLVVVVIGGGIFANTAPSSTTPVVKVEPAAERLPPASRRLADSPLNNTGGGFIASATAQTLSQSAPAAAAPVPAVSAPATATQSKLDKEAEALLKTGQPSTVAVPASAMEPRKFLGNVSLYSTDEIRQNVDWLKDRVTVSLRALERALYGLVWVMNEQMKDAFDIKFFQDVEGKLQAMLTSWQDAMTKRWGEGVTLASRDKNSNSVKELEAKAKGLETELTTLKERADSVEKRVDEAVARLDGQDLVTRGIKEINLIVEVNMLSRTMRLLDPSTKEVVALRAFYDPHGGFFGKQHFASRSLAFVSERDRHLCVWLFDIGAVWPTGNAATNVVELPVRSNVPTKCYLDVKGASRFLAQATPMSANAIVAMLRK